MYLIVSPIFLSWKHLQEDLVKSYGSFPNLSFQLTNVNSPHFTLGNSMSPIVLTFRLLAGCMICRKVWLMLTSSNWNKANAKLPNKVFTGQWISGTPFARFKAGSRNISRWWCQWGSEIITGGKWRKPHLLGQSWEVGRNKSRGCAMKAGSAKDRAPITFPSTFNCHRCPYSLRGGQR